MITVYGVIYHIDGENEHLVHPVSFPTEEERDQWIANAKGITVYRKYTNTYPDPQEEDDSVTIHFGKSSMDSLWEGSTDAELMGLSRY